MPEKSISKEIWNLKNGERMKETEDTTSTTNEEKEEENESKNE